jgi:very-short-patch-repair endonuclease
LAREVLELRVLRFTDDEVFENTDRVAERIKEYILQIRSGRTHPLTPSEEGEF